ncbi:MAG: MerR family transcriptional regulator [Chloroflexi bacterium]|nr:MerR family transcriptional regulator [Chloroflexota bacterium]
MADGGVTRRQRGQRNQQAVGRPSRDGPSYVISVAARLVGMSPRTLRSCEKAGLITPSRLRGRRRLYSPLEIERLRRIKTLMSDMGVNLAGVEVALRLMDHIASLEGRIERMGGEPESLRRERSRETGR